MFRTFPILMLLGGLVATFSSAVLAEGWVLEPSVTLELGYDDNYDMDVLDPQSVTIGKVTGELSLRRASDAHYFRGGLLADAVTYEGDDRIDPNSNQVAYFYTTFIQPRYRWGANFRYRRDSLLREALTDANLDQPVEEEQSPDATVDQLLDVTRQRVYFNPFYRYNLSRLTDWGIDYQLSAVEHDVDEDQISEDQADDVQDYVDQGINLRLGHKLTPLDKVIARIGYSFYTTDIREEEQETDYRTSYLRLGYERSLSPTFTVGGDVGYRVTEFTESDEDITKDGPVMSLSAVKTTGLTRFELRAGLELYPSSIGQVVQTQELIANVSRDLTELLQFSLRSRFYENTALSGDETVFEVGEAANADNDRRSMTIRPEIRWQVAREWTLGAAYRYRREKLESRPTFAEGNAVLFSVKYTRLSALSGQ